MTYGKIVALDVGDVRIGIATCDELRLIASPHSVYKRVGFGPDVRHIKALCDQLGTRDVLCGLPRNMDGSEGGRVDTVRAFADILASITDIEIDFYDERMSTMAAYRFLDGTGTYGKKRKGAVDTLSAEIILQGYLDRERNMR